MIIDRQHQGDVDRFLSVHFRGLVCINGCVATLYFDEDYSRAVHIKYMGISAH